MTIAELRAAFKTRSGDAGLTNAEIDVFINAGLKLLDFMTEFAHAPARAFILAAIGTKQDQFSSICRAVQEVWGVHKLNGRHKLEKVRYRDLRAEYADLDSVSNGKPLYYAPGLLRATPHTFDPSTLADYSAYIDTVSSDFQYRSVTFMPPCDEEYLIEVHGLFHSPELSDTNTQNWWSVNYSEAVLNAALYHFEISFRNTEGANDYLKAVTLVTNEISNDKYEEDAAEISVMEG